jgi:hypothetical protein
MEHADVGTRPTRDGFQAVRWKLGRHIQHPQEDKQQPVSVERGSMQQRPSFEKTIISINKKPARLTRAGLRFSSIF